MLRLLSRVAVCSAVIVLAGMLVHAADHDNAVRFGIAWISPTGDLTTSAEAVEDIDAETRLELSGDLKLEPDDAVGLAVSYERRMTDRIGLEVGLFGAEHEVTGRVRALAQVIRNADNVVLDQFPVDVSEKFADIQVTTWTVGANFYVLRGKSVEVYVSPMIAYVLYGDLEADGESIPIDDDFTWGAGVGVDVPFGAGRWAVNAVARYIDTEAQPSESGPDAMALGVEPFVLQAGVGYRF